MSEPLIADPDEVIHETAGDDTLCGDYWYIMAIPRIRGGWHHAGSNTVTCLRCVVRRIAWLD